MKTRSVFDRATFKLLLRLRDLKNDAEACAAVYNTKPSYLKDAINSVVFNLSASIDDIEYLRENLSEEA